LKAATRRPVPGAARCRTATRSKEPDWPLQPLVSRVRRRPRRGESRQWTSEITEQEPDERIAWKTIEGEVKNDGVVTFEQAGDGLTRINLEMEVEGESTAENVAGDLLGIVKSQVHGDLERFKQLIESRNEETGAWRGEVQDGDTK
jgi:uncharacterized membrane protein